jgi:ABC-type nitrate/sulfonate/bicarbonate transport system substrate-binding protein
MRAAAGLIAALRNREEPMKLAPALLAALLLVVASSAAAAADPVTVRIAWVVPIGNWASMIYHKKDLMTHFGKTYVAEPVHFQSTPQMITALATGELEIADLAYSTFAISVENAGMTDLRIIADESRDGAHGHQSGQYVVLKNGPVKTIDDLKGKVLATVGVGAALDIPVRAMLRRHGLEDKRDYTMIEVAFPNMGAMLADHKIDFMPTVAPFKFDPRLVAISRPLFTVADALGGPTDFIVWVARAGFIAKHRAAMVDLLEDAVRAAHYFTDNENRDDILKIAAKVSGAPVTRLGYVLTKADAYRDPNMMPDLASLQHAIDVQHDVGFLKAPLDVKEYADLSLVEEAAARIK